MDEALNVVISRAPVELIKVLHENFLFNIISHTNIDSIYQWNFLKEQTYKEDRH